MMRSEQIHALENARQNYEAFFNTIDEFLFVLDEQANMIHVNSTVVERLGYSLEELLGNSVLMVHPAERREEAAHIVGEMLAGTAEFCPVPLRTKAGELIPVETRVNAGFWNGKPVIFGVTKDISRIKLSEEKFSKVFYINPSACGLSDLVDRTYVEVNDAFLALTGYERNEVIGKTALELGLMSEESRLAIVAMADANGKIVNAEATLRVKNGTIKQVLLSAENVFIQDKKYRFTAVADVTDQRQAEVTIKNLLAEKELILKEVHHRIKNNMNTIIGLFTLQAEKLSDPVAIAALDDASARVQSMMVLYDKLYQSNNFSQISMVNYLPTLVDSILANFPHYESIRVEKNIVDFILSVDQVQPLGIILNELLTNIMKYAFTNQRDRVIYISTQVQGTLASISIQDNGKGIPQSVDFQHSTGFGLMLIGLLAKQLKGTLQIERNQGTKVVLEFPI